MNIAVFSENGPPSRRYAHQMFIRGQRLWLQVGKSNFEFNSWGRVTHIWVSKLTSIGLDNGLSPNGAKPISEPMWNIVHWTPGKKHQWNLNWNWYISIQENAFENAIWTMAATMCWIVTWQCYFNQSDHSIQQVNWSTFLSTLLQSVTDWVLDKMHSRWWNVLSHTSCLSPSQSETILLVGREYNHLKPALYYRVYRCPTIRRCNAFCRILDDKN